MRRNYSLLKFDTMSEICTDAGQVFLATMLIEPLINKTTNSIIVLLGAGMLCAAWSIGLILSTK